MKKLFFLLLALILAFTLAACSGVDTPNSGDRPSTEDPSPAPDLEPDNDPEPEEEENIVSVIFDYDMYDENDNAIYKYVDVKYGETFSEPTAPSRDHFTFAGWYDWNTNEPWSFETDTASYNTHLYAKWEAIDYTVTFIGDLQIEPIIYNIYSSGMYLPDVEREDWDVIGFYADEEYTVKLDKLPEAYEIFEDYSVYVKAEYIPFTYYVKNLYDGIDGNETAVITGIRDSSYTELTIPESIKGYLVSDIDFDNNELNYYVEKVTIPGYISEITAEAFYELPSLREVVIGEGVTKIASSAFSRCTSLTKLEIPASVTVIERYAFYGCTSLEEVSIPGNLESIDDSAFYNCSSLKIARLHSSALIGGFNNCVSLEFVELGPSAERVGEYAFYNCTSLTEIDCYSVFDAVTFKQVGAYAFTGCTSLNYLGAFSKMEAVGDHAFSGCTSLLDGEELTLTSIITIGNGAFYQVPIRTLILSDKLESIGNRAFAYNDNLEGHLIIPGSLLTMGTEVFDTDKELKIFVEIANDKSMQESWWYGVLDNGRWAYGIKRIYLGSFFKTYETDGGTFTYTSDGNNNAYLTIVDYEPHITYSDEFYVTVPKTIGGKNVVGIQHYAFESSDKIRTVTLPETIRYIGEYAFYDCNDLLRVMVNSHLDSVGSYAFAECEKYEFMYFRGIGTLGKCVFQNTAIKTVYFYDNKAPDDKSWDYFWSSGTLISNTVYGVYLDDTGLVWKQSYNEKTGRYEAVIVDYTYNSEHNYVPYVTIPKELRDFHQNKYTVTKIAGDAFFEDENIKSVILPDSITEVVSSAFYGCTQLEYTAYDNALYIGTANNPYMFCVKAVSQDISSVTLHPDTVYIGYSAFFACTALSEITIPANVKVIGMYAFNSCYSITSINIPDNVEEIEYSAFSDCYSISDAVIGAVEKIGDSAFKSCGITNLTLKEGIIHIGNSAFNDCYPYEIIIPDSVTYVGSYAFHMTSHIGGQGLTHRVTVGNGVQYIGRYAFCSNFGDYLTGGYSDANGYYLGNATNPYLIFIAPKDNSVSSFTIRPETRFIYTNAFSDSSIENIVIPSNVIGIVSSAFSGCTSLKTVTLSNGLTYIGSDAFYGCTSLTEIILPATLKTIESEAFRNCTSLTRVVIPMSVTSIDYDICSGCDNVTIYSARSARPETWDYSWNASNKPVVWKYGI